MSYSRSQVYILNLLAKRDYSYQELLDKLAIRNLNKTEAAKELEIIVTNNWINDKRLAENLILYYSKTRGPNWINQKLKQRKIPTEIITKNLSKIKLSTENQDKSNLKLKIEKKYNITNWKVIDLKTKAKIWNYLLYHGFNNPYEMISDWSSS